MILTLKLRLLKPLKTYLAVLEQFLTVLLSLEAITELVMEKQQTPKVFLQDMQN